MQGGKKEGRKGRMEKWFKNDGRKFGMEAGENGGTGKTRQEGWMETWKVGRFAGIIK